VRIIAKGFTKVYKVYICIQKYMETTIRLNQVTKEQLDAFKQYKSESYDELVRKLIYLAKMCEKDPKLSQKTIIEIREARERIKKGDFYTEDEAKKILGL